MVEIIDFKFGRTKPSDTQLPIYAAGAVKTFGLWGQDIKITILQPKDLFEPIKSRVLLPEEIQNFILEVNEAKGEALKENPTFYKGDHCRWCKVKGFCPEWYEETKIFTTDETLPAVFHNTTPKNSGVSGESSLPAPISLTDEQIYEVLRYKAKVQQILGFINSCEGVALKKATSGEPISGTSIITGRPGNRRFKDDVGEELREKGIDIYDNKLKTPAQVERENPGVDLQKYTYRPKGKKKLAIEEEK